MAIIRRALKCLTCGHKTITRTALGNDDYQEFAFACGGCGIEMKYGMNLKLNKRLGRILQKNPKISKTQAFKLLGTQRHIQYVNFVNAKPCKEDATITDVIALDGLSLIPVQTDGFSPFMVNVGLVGIERYMEFGKHHAVRRQAVEKHYPEILRLRVHFDAKQWDLFDSQFQQLDLNMPHGNEKDRLFAMLAAFDAATFFLQRTVWRNEAGLINELPLH